MNRRGFFIEAVRVAETWLPTIIPQSTESQRTGNRISTAMIFAGSHFVNVLRVSHQTGQRFGNLFTAAAPA
jgi:hypothetical protein